MKKLLLAWCLFLLTTSCRGYLNPDDPDAKLVTKHPIFLKKSANDEKELFGTWNFEPPNTFYVYEDGEGAPYVLEIYEMNDCWSINWGTMSEVACSCSF